MTNDPRIAARLHVAGTLASGTVALDAARAHYLRNVLRLAPGAAIAVFNATDGEHAATITTLTKSAAIVALAGRRRAPAPEPDLWLCFAPIKRTRLDAMVEKATELGVSRLVPVFTRHTVMERVNSERLAAIAVEAAEQSERLSVPAIAPPIELATLLAEWQVERTLVVGDETGGGTPIAAALTGLAGPLAVLTGPEGGFARDELDRLANHPSVRRVGLGPRILKADTAAIAALAVVQAIAGDGAAPPRFIAVDARAGPESR
ncbi:MAG: 16S rRNA (uracil(1498)-N(3))-methyltransferase [Alphaproteobacteria bacterium]|nr:16S rRNA (uracil(1498)-N(3))-methyltransferase [Alphaproteobacteria bacterium]